MLQLLESLHPVIGIAAVADAFSGTVASDVVHFKNHREMLFLVHKAAGATGTSTITIEACDNTTPSTTAAIPFWYKACTSGDSWGALTAATVSGFTTTAGADQMYMISVTQEQMIASGYSYLRLKAVESANDPVLGGVIILPWQPVHATDHSSIID